MPDFSFKILHQSSKSKAKLGQIITPHGVINTPCFVPVATNASLKGVPESLLNPFPNIELMFCNTYHLLLQPGPETISLAGGLHNFMNHSAPLITDSGGFQVFSLAYGSVFEELKSKGKQKGSGCVLKITEEGVLFRSYRDGKAILLTPENSVTTQKNLGADIIIPLDELLPYHVDQEYLKESLNRTHRWEKRSLDTHLKDPRKQAMYGVVHGGPNLDLRKYSCDVLSDMSFNGFAIGGSVGKTKEELDTIVKFTRNHLPPEKPVHLLGIGDPTSIKNLVQYGIDSFDSSYPTKAARHGTLFTSEGPLKIEKRQYANDFNKIDSLCKCLTCQKHHRAYIHHLFKSNELAGLSLASIHNLQYMVDMMEKIRLDILKNLI
ncbi:Queuine tRNA-ribosyltransferase [Candidatus Clavichlamydia salmonicola]|uniref:tRNA guanosine(34) transglycosylase Tgt n=1 Tax=Candidatus Clavichlamydia salmonicola TaxID=469812 RepID=UPI001890D08A|nr:tRNA guanosine(34) transglycosylase Tgt [Candidatus Clavichlamydia salmonicola]MBF5051217.1 Queuine tRNA-ribosyltransferase [Candidatus Clavichlamydia salmonicola]